jgi:hypothetical protein
LVWPSRLSPLSPHLTRFPAIGRCEARHCDTARSGIRQISCIARCYKAEMLFRSWLDHRSAPQPL